MLRSPPKPRGPPVQSTLAHHGLFGAGAAEGHAAVGQSQSERHLPRIRPAERRGPATGERGLHEVTRNFIFGNFIIFLNFLLKTFINLF